MEEVVYRIVKPEDWAIAQREGVVPRCASDQRDGFVHLSTADQLLTTARLYYPQETGPLVLVIRTADLGRHLKWERVERRGGVHFPRFHGGCVPISAVQAVIPLVCLTDGGFAWGTRAPVL